MNTPCVTFDQPLYAKATAIIAEKGLNIVCRLGGFHLLMSYLGSIGHVMSGSGLEELLEQMFAPNVTQHILSGKAYTRAVRGHMMIQSALISIIIESLMSSGLLSTADIDALAGFDKEDDVVSIQCITERVECVLSDWKDEMSEYRMVKFWIQYIDRA